MSERLDYERLSPDEMDAICTQFSAFYTSFTDGIMGGSGRRFDLHERVLKPELSISDGDKVLEVGVGNGAHLSSYVDFDYYGVDIDDENLAHARDVADFFRIDRRRLVLRNSRRLPFSDNSFDKLFYACTLHEVDNIQDELIRIDRILKSGGRVVVVERMCAYAEVERERANLRAEPVLLWDFFSRRSYSCHERRFNATYFGESLEGEPSFSFYLFSAQKESKN